MKKVIQFLPALAIFLGSGLALATAKTTMAPQYYKNSSTGNWRSIAGDGLVLGSASGQYSCVATTYECVCDGFDGLGNPIGLMTGTMTQNP